jgi:hypothetical protein
MPQLGLVTNDKFKRSFKTSCTVKMNDTVDTFTDFVAVGYSTETGETTMLHNTDALTLGQAYLMLAKAFNDSMSQLSPEERANVVDCLGVNVG